MSMTSNLGMKVAVFESDCLDLVQSCWGEKEIGEIKLLIKDILSLKASFEYCGITWIGRKGNALAHKVAQLAASRLLPSNWCLRPLPLWLPFWLMIEV
ncbi:Ribonuclease H superfamily [Sesbania bispinosa]|nr:Ribonuclease H superfamily [Sesbania bispinosa]